MDQQMTISHGLKLFEAKYWVRECCNAGECSIVHKCSSECEGMREPVGAEKFCKYFGPLHNGERAMMCKEAQAYHESISRIHTDLDKVIEVMHQ